MTAEVRKSAATGVKLTLLGQWTKFALQSVALIVLSRLLTPTEFGVYAVVLIFTTAAQVVSDFGMSSASIQARDVSDAQKSNLFWLNIAIGCLLATILWSSSQAIASFYHNQQLSQLLRFVAIVFVVQAATTQLVANATRALRFRFLMTTDVLAQFLAVTAAVLAAAAGLGVWSLIVQQAVLVGTTFVLLLVGGKWVPALPSKAPMRWMISFGANTFGVQALNYASANIDTVLIGRVQGPTMLGVYDKGYQFLRLPIQQIATPLTRVALPVLSRAQDDRDEFARLVTAAQTALNYTLGAVFAVTAGLATPLFQLLIGSQWNQSATVYRLLALGGVFQVMGYVYYWVFLSKNLTGVQLRYSVFTRVLMISAIVVTAPVGIEAVATAVSVGLFVNWAILSLFPIRAAGLDVKALVIAALRPVAIHAVVVLVLYVAMRSISNYPPLEAVCIGIIGSAVVYLGAFALIPMVRNDVGLIVRIARSARAR